MTCAATSFTSTSLRVISRSTASPVCIVTMQRHFPLVLGPKKPSAASLRAVGRGKHISRVSYMLLSKGSFCFPGFSLLRGSRSWLALCLWGFQLLILGRRPWPLQLATFLASDLSVSYLACVLILILAIASALFQGRVCSFETGDV